MQVPLNRFPENFNNPNFEAHTESIEKIHSLLLFSHPELKVHRKTRLKFILAGAH